MSIHNISSSHFPPITDPESASKYNARVTAVAIIALGIIVGLGITLSLCLAWPAWGVALLCIGGFLLVSFIWYKNMQEESHQLFTPTTRATFATFQRTYHPSTSVIAQYITPEAYTLKKGQPKTEADNNYSYQRSYTEGLLPSGLPILCYDYQNLDLSALWSPIVKEVYHSIGRERVPFRLTYNSVNSSFYLVSPTDKNPVKTFPQPTSKEEARDILAFLFIYVETTLYRDEDARYKGSNPPPESLQKFLQLVDAEFAQLQVS